MEPLTDEHEIRNQISSLISAVQAFDSEEDGHIQDTLDWIKSDDEIWRIDKPATPPKHLVCYTVLFDPRVNQLLLL